jgi:hypothetical protein
VSDDAATADEAAPGEAPSDETPSDEAAPALGPLDVFLFAPVGVALTVAEDLPGLIEKGRQRVEQEISNARILGEFVVTAGQKDLAKRLGKLFGQGRASDEGADDDTGVDEPKAEGGEPATAWSSPKPKPAADPADQAVVEQTFAGYDTLSASQVVRRLESLDHTQLRAVHRYEASHRNRRTILNRTQQLMESEPVIESEPVVGSNGSAP